MIDLQSAALEAIKKAGELSLWAIEDAIWALDESPESHEIGSALDSLELDSKVHFDGVDGVYRLGERPEADLDCGSYASGASIDDWVRRYGCHDCGWV